MWNRTKPNRRTFLRGTATAIALPVLESLLPAGASASSGMAKQPRLVAICTSLGLHGPSFFPETPGSDYQASEYLKPLDSLRPKYSVISGLSHPDQSGADGHSSERTWLTAARHPGLGGFRNSISVDQLVAEQQGFQTRFPSLVLGTDRSSQSYTHSGVMIPAEDRPSNLFAKLFLKGKPEDVAKEMRNLNDGRSILDAVSGEAKRLSRKVDGGDRMRLEEYFESVRDTERRLALAEEWSRKEKPEVEEQPPTDIVNESDLIGRMSLMLKMIPLALQTDSTRVITFLIQGRNDVPPVPGVSMDHHNLSHHGKDEAKIQQLKRIESAQMLALAEFLKEMDSKQVGEGSLLDSTMTLFGSNLGNANSHDTRNLPLILAGGNFRHGQFWKETHEIDTPLSNLFVAMLQRMGVETDQFGTSTSSGIRGLSD